MNTELFQIVNANAERLERRQRKEIRDKNDLKYGLYLLTTIIVCILLSGFVEML